MKLRDLNARFIFYKGAGIISYENQEATLDNAHGIAFQCPLCATGKEVKQGAGEGYDCGEPERRCVPGVHSIICWFKGRVPDDLDPKPGRWNPSGTGIDDLTFVPPGAVSVLLLGGCNWHGFVTNGEAA